MLILLGWPSHTPVVIKDQPIDVRVPKSVRSKKVIFHQPLPHRSIPEIKQIFPARRGTTVTSSAGTCKILIRCVSVIHPILAWNLRNLTRIVIEQFIALHWNIYIL